jgi:hypothetical protein
MDGEIYIPNNVGDGVQFGYEKLKPGVARRIEELGKMNDRRLKYVAAGDAESLLKLADEYEKRKMPKMAKEIRKEASDVQ